MKHGRIRAVAVGVLAASAITIAGAPAHAALPPGAEKPPAGTGMGTQAAYDNPLCDESQGTYGRLDFGIKGGVPLRSLGALCVAVWPEGKDNGGATSPGVTRDAIKVIFLVPNDAQVNALPAGQRPVVNATGATGTVPNAIKDALAPYEKFFELYGRKIDSEFVISSGDDEAAQRADAVTVAAKKPFVVVDVTGTAHDAFEAQIASKKIITYGPAASFDAVQKQAPYRWGSGNVTNAAINMAEFLGNQLVGKKAEWAGDALKSKTRKLGMVSVQGVINEPTFASALKTNKVTIAPDLRIQYPVTASSTVDPEVAKTQAPLAIGKFKEAGVTSVILYANSGMIPPLLAAATSQDYFPEWIITGYSFADFPFFARGYDQAQWAHAFGMTSLPPTATISATSPINDIVQWYWGLGKGTSSQRTANVHWLMRGLMYAGPKLTPETFRQGWFAAPSSGGARDNETTTLQSGLGRTTGLPYDDYLGGNVDFTVYWWDPSTMGPAIGTVAAGMGTGWYLDGGKRYSLGNWPTKKLNFFSKDGAILQIADQGSIQPVPCHGCPSETGAGGSSTG